MTAREYPVQDYFPGCVAILVVRFEEFTGDTSVPEPDKRVTLRRAGDQPSPGDDDPPTEVESSDDGFTQPLIVIPKTCALGRNGIQQADTCTLEFKYSDLPLDPRTIRAIAVQVYMGTIEADDFAAGVSGSDKSADESGSSSGPEKLRIVPYEFTDGKGNPRSNLRFEGFADDMAMQLSDDEPLVTIECTDNTRQLIDQEAPPQLVINPAKDIADAIVDYLGEFPQFRGFAVKYLPEGGTQPLIDGVAGKTARRKGKGPPPGNGDSVWDYLVDITGMVSHNIRFEGTTIIVQRARALLKSGFAVRPDDPFVIQGGRELEPSGTVLERRLMVYGRNVMDLEISRAFTKQSAMNIEVRSYVPEIKENASKTLIARHPPKEGRQTKANPGNKGEQTFKVVKTTGISDLATLKRWAQDVYEQINRNELQAVFTTKNLASYGGGNDDPDLLDLCAGDPIDIELQREDSEGGDNPSTITELEDVLAQADRAVAYMKRLGFGDDFAERYAKAYVHVGLTSTFIVRAVGIDWDESEGIEIEVEAVNFAVIERSEVESDEEPDGDPATDGQGTKI